MTPPAVSQSIARLSSPDPAQREKAAAELFRLGCAAAEPVLKTWFADPEFRRLVPSRGPLLTVGVAVPPAQFAEIRRLTGAPLAEVPPGLEVQEFELRFPHGVRLDILAPREPSAGPIARFLQRFGPGIQQVECQVQNVARAAALIHAKFALAPLYPEPRPGAGGTRVNFFLAPAAEGRKVLLELVETPRPSPAKH